MPRSSVYFDSVPGPDTALGGKVQEMHSCPHRGRTEFRPSLYDRERLRDRLSAFRNRASNQNCPKQQSRFGEHRYMPIEQSKIPPRDGGHEELSRVLEADLSKLPQNGLFQK